MRATALALSLILAAGIGSPADTRVPPAQLITFGQVLVNHSVLPSGSTVYEGDHIATETDSKALIVMPGRGRVEIRNSSEVTYGPHGIALDKGVVGTELMPVEFGGYTVEPQVRAGNGAWLLVSRRSGRLVVAVYRGEAWIREKGAAPLLVPAGSFALQAAGTGTRLDDGSPSGDAESKRSAGSRAGAETAGRVESGQGPAAATSGWTIGPLSHAASVALVTAVGATAVGGAIAAVALTGDSPSPSQ